MTILGATGHQVIPEEVIGAVLAGVRTTIHESEPPIRVATALAAGADQLIAEEVLQSGGRVDAVIPSKEYESTFSARDQQEYRRLLEQADTVLELGFPEPSEEAFWAAGQTVVDRCEVLIAIWDGRPARGLGGTSDVVRYARERERDVRIVWLPGVSRT